MNKSLISWALYDVSNTVFNLGVVGLFLPLYINSRQGTTDADLGYPLAISMAIVLVASPLIGALTDQLKGRIRIFTVLNVLATVATCLIGLGSNLYVSLGVFSIAFIAVYLAELLYNAMLADASTPKNRGAVGGISIAVGYLGSLAVVLLVLQYEEMSSNHGFILQILGVIFFVTAAPMTLFFKEVYNRPESNQLGPTNVSLFGSTLTQIKSTRTHFKQNPQLLSFFVARYFYMVAVTTGSTFAVMYGMNTIGFSEREVELVLLLGTLVAIPSAMLWGYVVDKSGPGNALKWDLLGWALILAGSVSIPWFHLNPQLWWPLSIFTGLIFAGLWVADRPLLIQLSPSKLGEMFGIYGMVSRSAFLTGAVAWPLIAVTMGLGQPTAIFFLMCCTLVGIAILLLFVDTSKLDRGQNLPTQT